LCLLDVSDRGHSLLKHPMAVSGSVALSSTDYVKDKQPSTLVTSTAKHVNSWPVRELSGHDSFLLVNERQVGGIDTSRGHMQKESMDC
jgi:hypothetical protein